MKRSNGSIYGRHGRHGPAAVGQHTRSLYVASAGCSLIRRETSKQDWNPPCYWKKPHRLKLWSWKVEVPFWNRCHLTDPLPIIRQFSIAFLFDESLAFLHCVVYSFACRSVRSTSYVRCTESWPQVLIWITSLNWNRHIFAVDYLLGSTSVSLSSLM